MVEKAAECPWDRASWLSRTCYTFVLPLLRLGSKKTLASSDLPPIPRRDDVRVLSGRIQRAWNRECDKRGQKASLSIALVRCFCPELCMSAAWTTIEYAAIVLQASVLGPFASWVSSGGRLSVGIGYAVLLVFLSATQGVAHHCAFYVSMRGSWNARNGMVDVLHDKLLRVSRARLSSSGNVYSLVANDSQRFEMFTNFIHSSWLSVVVLAAIYGMLWTRVGPRAASAGCGVVLLSVMLQIDLARRFKRLRAATAAATDRRVRLTGELVTGVLAIKVLRWENPFAEKIAELRRIEAKTILWSQRLKGVNSAFYFATTGLASLATFIVFVYGDDGTLTIGTASTVVAVISVLRVVIGKHLARFTSLAPEVLVAVRRMQKFLLAPEVTETLGVLNGDDNDKTKNQVVLSLHDAAYRWGESEKELPLSNEEEDEELGGGKATISAFSSTVSRLSFELRRSEIMFVTGKVSSGKTSLLEALLGELELVCGQASVRRDLRIAYAPQQPTIFAASVRENIVYASPFDQANYERAIKVAELGTDLTAWADGDQTEIGERGVNMSGGQQARVGLARAAYAALAQSSQHAVLMLIDDPLAAIDGAVAIKCANNIRSLADETGAAVLLATHQTRFVETVADKVLSLDDYGRASIDIVERRTPTPNDAGAVEGVVVAEESKEGDLAANEAPPSLSNSSATKDHGEESDEKEEGKKQNQLVVAEERAVGRVSWSTWVSYARAGGLFFVGMTAASFLSAQLAMMGAEWYVLRWSQQSEARQGRQVNAVTYSTVIGAALVCALAASFLFFFVTSRASTALHDGALRRVLSSTLSFFHSNPVGRIINRFSSDVAAADELLSQTLFDFIQVSLIMLSAVALAVASIWFIAIALPFLFYAFVVIERFVSKSMHEIKRMDSINKSPVFEVFSSTLRGLVLTRSYRGAAERAQSTMYSKLSLSAACYYWWMCANRFLGFVLDSLCTALLACLCVLAVVMRNQISPELLALALIYGAQLSGNFQYAIRMKALSATYMTSVERLLYYRDHIPIEIDDAAASNTLRTKQRNWPTVGAVTLENVSCRYRADLPTILFDVSVSFPAGKKSGVCGRTGSGKSSMLLAVARLNDVFEGRVLVDGVDVSTLGLDTLRSSVASIPQEPVLFSGSLRFNVDPFDQHTDEECLSALSKAGIASSKADLDDRIEEGGANWSVGSRQLCCLARALILRRRVVSIDEATAHVDSETDILIQRTLSTAFENVTVIVVAHRIPTILDAAYVVVLDAGRVLESGDPRELAKIPDGVFKTMIQSSTASSSAPQE